MSEGDSSADLDPSRVEQAMTNHVELTTNAEQINGGATPSLAELGRQDSSESLDPKPKSTFKITSVTLHTQKGSSQDGRHSFGEDEDEGPAGDSLVQTDAEDSPAPSSSIADAVKQQQHQRQDRVDSTSRFKVVKIQKREPYVVGRWRISDFMSEPEAGSSKATQDANHIKHSESAGSSRSGSSHYVHGVDDPSKNPLASITSNNQPLPSIQQSPHAQSAPPPLVPALASEAGTTTPAPAAHTNNYELSSDGSIASASAEGGVTAKVPSQDSLSSTLLPSSQTGSLTSRTGQTATSSTSSLLPPPPLQPQQTLSSDQSSTTHANTQNVPETTPSTVSAAGAVPPSSAGGDAESHAAAVSGADSQQGQTQEEVRLPTSPLPIDPQGASGGVEELAANLTELVDPSTAADGERTEDADAAATGMAIDNKIEQAMDLVKSHLMLAVREEVEDLKLQIKQLIERNNQLEQENKLLRSSAAPETMAQLALLNRQQNH